MAGISCGNEYGWGAVQVDCQRLGWLATTVFLDLNGEPVDLGDDDAFRLVLDVAEGRIGVEDIAEHLITS